MMRLGVLAFLAGIALFHTLAELPDRRWTWALPGVLAALRYLPWLRLPAWGAAGLLWALLWSEPPPAAQLPVELQGVDLQAVGWVASIPAHAQRSLRFQFTVDSLTAGATALPWQGKLRLSWYEPLPALQVGDRWALTVRLHRPRQLANPGSADQARWLFSNRIAALGYVRRQPEPQLLQAAARYPLDRFRQQLAERFAALLPSNPYRGILTALAIGDEQAIRPEQWDILTRTGTGHLISVSGLHIGMVAALVFLVVRTGWSRLPRLAQRWPAAKAGALLALLAAAAYALLAGFSLPTQRALVMLAVALFALFAQRAVVPSRILALALWVVLLADPEAPLSYGFWLSFGAVAAILYAIAGRRLEQPLREWLRLQLAITLALLPATLILFQQIPLLSPIANLVAIPWSNITVVPLTLLAALAGGISEPLQSGLLQLAALTLQWLWDFLVWLSRSPWALLHFPAPPWWTLGFALPGLLLLLGPRGWPARWLGGVLLLPVVFLPRAVPAAGEFWFTLLDVGKGLATVIATRHHVLVYDTGPRRDNFDTGRSVLVPYLWQQGIGQVDRLVVSHADRAHMGGTRALLERLPVKSVFTPSLRAAPIEGAEPCQAGLEWHWDEVHFQVLHPPPGALGDDDGSCVLLVTGKQRLLLPGDIGATTATALAQTYGAALTAEVLVAPHQGARPAFSPAFVAAVQPQYVLLSNEFRTPAAAQAAAAPYQQAGAVVLDTTTEGAISFHLDGAALQPHAYRRETRRYWHTP